MKRIISIFLSTILILGVSGELLSPAFAVTSVSKEKAAYKKALKEENKAKETYDAANVNYKKGSFGFYQWIADTQTGWMKEDAEEALLLLNTSTFKSYIEQGNPDDATDLQNMKYSLKLFKTLAELRANEDIFTNLQPPTIRSVFMARAQIQADASSAELKHMYDEDCDLAESLECLSWGYSDPFFWWYTNEKEGFIEKRKYTLNKYDVDIATIEFEKYINQNDFDYDAYLEETKQFGQTGHYKTICYRGDIVTGSTNIYLDRADKVFFGLAYSGYGCCSLRVNGDGYPVGYSVKEYTDLFNKYYKAVYPKNEINEYKEAKKATKQALKALKAAAKPSKPKAKRNKKLLM